MLEVKGLRFGYVLGQDIIDNVDFSIGEGEFIAIGGRNGCGKTTVTRLLMGLEKPRSGKIYYNDTDITALPPSERGRFIGYVFQQPDRQMFRPTVAEEVPRTGTIRLHQSGSGGYYVQSFGRYGHQSFARCVSTDFTSW